MTRLRQTVIAGMVVMMTGSLAGIAPSAARDTLSTGAVNEAMSEAGDVSLTPAGPVNAADLLDLPVRTYGTAPPISVVDDLLIKADGRVGRLVVDNGQFLQMGLDGKRVALPYDAATVPDSNGRPAFLRINIARSYGEVIREFRYELMSPTDYSVKAILGSSLSAADAPGAGTVRALWMNENNIITAADIDLSTSYGSRSHLVRVPFHQITLSRLGPMEETRLSTSLTLADLNALPAPDAF